jgi:ABC-type transporter Mla subunit MlaD
LYRALAGALGASDEVKTRLRDIRRALRETTASNAQLFATADQIEKHLDGILRVMRGDEVLRKREENTPMSIADRVESIMDEERFSDAKPTQTHVETFNVASQQFTQQLAALRQLIDTDLVNLEKQMEAAGAPWTPGRLPDWKPEK